MLGTWGLGGTELGSSGDVTKARPRQEPVTRAGAHTQEGGPRPRARLSDVWLQLEPCHPPTPSPSTETDSSPLAEDRTRLR